MYDVEQISIKSRVRIDLRKYSDEKPDDYLQAYKQPIMPMVDSIILLCNSVLAGADTFERLREIFDTNARPVRGCDWTQGGFSSKHVFDT
jgi:hypothetical protein